MKSTCAVPRMTGTRVFRKSSAGSYDRRDQRRLRRACAFAQSCQGLSAHEHIKFEVDQIKF